MVSDVPITYLGYVNRDSGIIEEAGHPLDGRAIEDTIWFIQRLRFDCCSLCTNGSDLHG